ncbi:MAG TPA: winged helix-turn-helix domain-containing protein [Nitrososphaeraceae archaeon]|jgi:predicted transcriptional regulator|nr:winged helix-turn-helix domain-containing protein [Nitrososphaeraceae archaeon]
MFEFNAFHKEIIIKNRCRNEIITSILEVVSREESARTKIMYELFYLIQLNEYISFLLDKDLISYLQRQQRNKRTPSFMITEKIPKSNNK